MLGLLVDANSCLHLYVNGMDQGVAAQDIPAPCYPFIDLYGQCEQVSPENLQSENGNERFRRRALIKISQNCVEWQVTIATNNLPAVGRDRGETRFQGDMEKADMVDGEKPVTTGPLFHSFLRGGLMFRLTSRQGSKRASAGLLLPRSTPTRPASTRRCARASRTCSHYQVRRRHRRRRCQSFPSPNCPFLPHTQDGYFNEDVKYNLCYCESCYKLRGDEAYYKRGEPPRDYALPFGWCRFALR